MRLIVLPDTTRLRSAILAWVRVMAPPDAVKGPTDPGDVGTLRAMPVEGTGLGMATSKDSVGVAMLAGVAPLASTVTVAEPLIDELPSAAAAVARLAGMSAWTWKSVTLNCEPVAGLAGEIEAVVTTSLRTTVPTGVPGQYSSYSPLGPLGIVVVVEPGAAVVVVEGGVVDPPAMAMIGAMASEAGGSPMPV